MGDRIRVGAVRYLNSKPLIYRLEQIDPKVELCLEVPSRLADRLDAEELDVALIPSIEYFRHPGWVVIPGMSIAAYGPVLSVKLYCRVPVHAVRSVAMDEGSRTSVALTRILFKEWHGIQPAVRPFPLGTPAQEVEADAVLVIGDRAIRPLDLGQVACLDLGHEWLKLTGLPFVFAMWVARPALDLRGVDSALRRARSSGQRCVAQIAAEHGPGLGLRPHEAVRYLTEYIRFDLGDREIQGLQLFYEWATRLGLAPQGVPLVFYDQRDFVPVR